MNQILDNIKNKSLKKKTYIIQFFIITILICLLFVYLLWRKYLQIKTSKVSDITNRSYNISKLYSNAQSNNITTNENSVSIIGNIAIPKINISYPIFSKYSDELLKISVCKFYGPSINSIGNVCIIGHNYNNDDFFSNLHLLNINDIIDIYDLNNNVVSYVIYEISEIKPNNLDYLSQDTKRKKRNNFGYL